MLGRCSDSKHFLLLTIRVEKVKIYFEVLKKDVRNG